MRPPAGTHRAQHGKQLPASPVCRRARAAEPPVVQDQPGRPRRQRPGRAGVPDHRREHLNPVCDQLPMPVRVINLLAPLAGWDWPRPPSLGADRRGRRPIRGPGSDPGQRTSHRPHRKPIQPGRWLALPRLQLRRAFQAGTRTAPSQPRQHLGEPMPPPASRHAPPPLAPPASPAIPSSPNPHRPRMRWVRTGRNLHLVTVRDIHLKRHRRLVLKTAAIRGFARALRRRQCSGNASTTQEKAHKTPTAVTAGTPEIGLETTAVTRALVPSQRPRQPRSVVRASAG